jgi:hypothetical protein
MWRSQQRFGICLEWVTVVARHLFYLACASKTLIDYVPDLMKHRQTYLSVFGRRK